MAIIEVDTVSINDRLGTISIGYAVERSSEEAGILIGNGTDTLRVEPSGSMTLDNVTIGNGGGGELMPSMIRPEQIEGFIEVQNRLDKLEKATGIHKDGVFLIEKEAVDTLKDTLRVFADLYDEGFGEEEQEKILFTMGGKSIKIRDIVEAHEVLNGSSRHRDSNSN